MKQWAEFKSSLISSEYVSQVLICMQTNVSAIFSAMMHQYEYYQLLQC